MTESRQLPDVPIAWVVPGPLRQVTGGYLYDARIVDGLRTRGWRVGVVDLKATSWPLDLGAGRRLAGAIAREKWGAVVVDEPRFMKERHLRLRVRQQGATQTVKAWNWGDRVSRFPAGGTISMLVRVEPDDFSGFSLTLEDVR